MIIDVFSKKLQVYPLKNKSALQVVSAFEKAFEKEGTPKSIFTDQGLEFTNSSLQNLLKTNFVQFRMANNKDIKAAVVERVNRTIKNKLFKIMTMRGTKKYIDCLQDVVNAYNETKHSATGVAPNNVNDSNAQTIFRDMYGVECPLQLRKNAVTRVTPGDTVRTKLDHKTFDRGYTSNWSNQKYTVATVNSTSRPQYRLSHNGETSARYYPEEIQKIDGRYRQVEKVIKRKDDAALVKWKYEPASQNSWLQHDELMEWSAN
ncbi:putative uncharacterized transposon-derived protein F54H12.3 [Halotydeus destructor]|nr:putative uncharacterized transposon-derived protein F54H12.3 [Halotydeus destructor]